MCFSNVLLFSIIWSLFPGEELYIFLSPHVLPCNVQEFLWKKCISLCHWHHAGLWSVKCEQKWHGSLTNFFQVQALCMSLHFLNISRLWRSLGKAVLRTSTSAYCGLSPVWNSVTWHCRLTCKVRCTWGRSGDRDRWLSMGRRRWQ